MTTLPIAPDPGVRERPGVRPVGRTPGRADGRADGRAPVSAEDLRIAGIVPLSTVDWPGKLAATVFCQGCPWRCTYCHNTAILDATAPGTASFADLEALLARRRGLLDAVVFSGGEATMQHALIPAAQRVREAGFAVGLHTGGAFPTRLSGLLGITADGRRVAAPLVDWVGFDVKAAPTGYDDLVGRANAWERAHRSLEMLLASGVEHELRMTVTPALLDQVTQVVGAVSRAGGRALVLQQARPDGAAEDFAAQLTALKDWPARFAEVAEQACTAGERCGVEVSARAG